MPDDYRRRRRDFLLKYRVLYSVIYWEFPDFWQERRELERLRPRADPEGRESDGEDCPETREIGVQVVWGGCQQWERSTQTEPLPALEPLPGSGPPAPGEKKPQRPTGGPEVTGTKPPAKPGSSKPATKDVDGGEPWYPASPAGCWNCGSRIHRYSRCPRPRERLFCYACGFVNVSIRDCPRCGGAWARTWTRQGGRQ
jgi:hypothetical protein